MTKIKIKDLPREMKISEEDLRKIKGGLFAAPRGQIFGIIDDNRLFGARKFPEALPFGSMRI